MTDRVWDQFLIPADKAQLARAKPKTPYGFGRRAALLSVDNYRAAIGDERKPLLDSLAEWPNSTGLAGWESLDRIAELLAAVRSAGVPVIHVTGMAAEDSGIPGWRARRGERGDIGTDAAAQDRYRRRYDIVDQARPIPGEVVLTKTAPSAFFGTPLLAYLIAEGIDTLIVVGEAVSGCVRATVVDGCSNRLRMIIVEDCVYDRHEASRAMNLFDMDQKYGDVISFAAAMEWATQQGAHPHAHHSHQSAAPAGPSDQTELPLPAIMARVLPPGATVISTSEHPISGHVLRQAGAEVLQAAREAMAAGFGSTPHVIATISARDLEPSDDERYRTALGFTDGGAIVMGVGYAPARDLSDHDVNPGPCPECGEISATVEAYIEPNRTPGQHRGAVLFSCDGCSTEWDIPVH